MDIPDLLSDFSLLRHPDCCLTLSSRLLEVITAAFVSNTQGDAGRIVLSIGSGTGLLEALLNSHMTRQHQEHKFSVGGVEVQQSSDGGSANRYLPENALDMVRGTWHLSPRIEDPDVTGLMFVYPRETQLVTRYLEGMTGVVKTVVWLGPQADWPEFESCFRRTTPDGQQLFQSMELVSGTGAGIADFEAMAIAQRRP